MSRSKKKAAKEKGRANLIDQMIVYLECADAKPPVQELYPLVGEMIESSFDVVAKIPVDYRNPPTGGFGMIGDSEMYGYKFQVDISEKVDRFKLNNLVKLMPKSMDVVIPSGVDAMARVSRYYISTDGRTMAGIPKYYYSPPYDPKGRAGLGAWIPLCSPISVGTKRVETAGGWREYTIFGSDQDGLAPSLLNVFGAASRAMWSVAMGAENGRSHLRFLTSESGATGFYDLRNSPLTAGGRKAALQHFVKSYTRKPDVGVREHFRGREEFDWFGLKCRVIPPEKLAERIEAAKIAKGG